MIRGFIMSQKTNKEQIREAIREYLKTPEGREEISDMLREKEESVGKLLSNRYHINPDRTQKTTPVNEDTIRGRPATPVWIYPENYRTLCRMHGQDRVDMAIKAGVLVVVS
jgi:hypothetical protein